MLEEDVIRQAIGSFLYLDPHARVHRATRLKAIAKDCGIPVNNRRRKMCVVVCGGVY